MRKIIAALLALLMILSCPLLSGCSSAPVEPTAFCMGFGSCEIALPETDGPLYVAGYHQGWEIEGVLDLQRANAVWIDTGDGGVLLIGIDCVGLSSATADSIRERLSGFCRRTGCTSVNVYSTHDHAGVDTLGLWGDVAMDGKNPAFMENLENAAVGAAETAYASRRDGELYFGTAVTEGMQRDSREPVVYDPTLYQFRFIPSDGTPGLRLVVFSAHAESLRGANRMVSRDYPGVMADEIRARTGDDVLFLPGAVGGLIMTSEQTEGEFDAVENRDLTGRRLADYALSIDGGDAEQMLPYELKTARVDFDVPLDNTLFMYYRFLGILGNEMGQGKGTTGYSLRTSLTVLDLGGRTLCMLPGEIFPELVTGEGLTENDPEPLTAVAARHGVDGLIVTGLCNDEIGYITVPSDYCVDESLPFIQEATDAAGRKHYEETNSVGRDAAYFIAEALDKALGQLDK